MYRFSAPRLSGTYFSITVSLHGFYYIIIKIEYSIHKTSCPCQHLFLKKLSLNHNKHVLYNLDADDIRRGEKAFRELINVDVPEVILNKVGKEIDKMARENPQRFVM
jgi:hypothetical protein